MPRANEKLDDAPTAVVRIESKYWLSYEFGRGEPSAGWRCFRGRPPGRLLGEDVHLVGRPDGVRTGSGPIDRREKGSEHLEEAAT
jgi:hypothetical protein